MRTLKNHASRLVGQIGAFGHALGLLIENDEEMALMNLSLLRENPALYRPPLSRTLLASHEEIEELLEAHLQDSNSLEAKVNTVQGTLLLWTPLNHFISYHNIPSHFLFSGSLPPPPPGELPVGHNGQRGRPHYPQIGHRTKRITHSKYNTRSGSGMYRFQCLHHRSVWNELRQHHHHTTTKRSLCCDCRSYFLFDRSRDRHGDWILSLARSPSYENQNTSDIRCEFEWKQQWYW